MKILTVSDVVLPRLYRKFDQKAFSDIDLVLGCGDLPMEYLTFLCNALGGPLYYVKGNHDIRYDEKPLPGCIDIHGRIVRYQGVRILGLGGSRWYNGGPNQYTEGEMKKIIRQLRFSLWWGRGVDIVIAHASPRYIHDTEDPCHRGFHCFGAFIDKYAPSYFIHGHIHRNFDHPQDRFTRVNNTKVINTYGYHIIDIDPETMAESA